MAWASTREAPPCAWSWDGRDGFEMYAEEAEACDDVARVVAEHGDQFAGCRVVEVGCGRGACLHYALTVLGASAVLGLDPSEGAVAATLRTVGALGGLAVVLRDPLPGFALDFGATVAWSHGVVEHVEGSAVDEHVALLARLSRRWVAISAPDPRSPTYAAWRRDRLDREDWPWGFEEPLDSYAPACRAAGLDVVFDGTTARSPAALAAFLRGPDGSTRPVPAGEPGLYTLVVGRVPA